MVVDGSLSSQNMWPHGVRTNEDMQRFSRLIVGEQACLEDYSQVRLPEDRSDIFLFVSRGGCAPGTVLAALADCVPSMMDELVQYAVNRGNSGKPQVAYETGAEALASDSWYDSAQLSRSHCICKINFGGEGKSNTRKFVNPDCQQWSTGKRFESVFLGALQQNSLQPGVGQNVYMHKAFHALLNRNRH